jgi:ABC-type oligopeptide transport system substrate-binding subunit
LLGIGVDVRELDGASYARRVQGFDFDMTEAAFPVSGYPGSEQAGYFGCADADTPGSENLAGVCDPAVEAAIGLVLSARDFAGKKAAVQALDAALLRGYYVVPWFYLPEVTVAWWQNRVAKPEAAVVMGVDLSLWWAR